MPWLRKVVFYGFVLVYLILCPLIVARMLGFVINPLTHRLEKTGLIYVSTNPPGAAFFVDGRMSPQRTPAVLRDLTPGEHFLRIELAGYNDWERNIPIVARKATVLDNTLLIPEEWPITRVSKGAYQNIFYTTDGMLVAVNPRLKDIHVFQTAAGAREKALCNANSIYSEGELVSLYKAEQSPFVLLEVTISDKQKFLWADLKENPPLIEDITDLFPQPPSRVAWTSINNGDLFAFYPSDKVLRINVKGKTIAPVTSRELPARLARPDGAAEQFIINNKTAVLTKEGGRIRLTIRQDFSGPQVYDIAKSSPSTNMYFEEKTGELFFLDDKGRLFRAQILPYHPVMNIPIPDALKIEISQEGQNL